MMSQESRQNLNEFGEFHQVKPLSSPKRQLDFDRFYLACAPLEPLQMTPEDEQYYINCADVRGGKSIDSIKNNIKRSQNAGKNSTAHFFTGHIGGGKSTELNRLKNELLEEEGYYVIYFTSDEDLNIDDVDIPDILLLIARQVSVGLEKIEISLSPPFFVRLREEISNLLQMPDEINVKLSVFFAEISSKLKTSPVARNQLRQYLSGRTDKLIDSLNQEILQPAIEQLQKQKKWKGLVVIVDNLERIVDQKLPNSNCSQQEYIFIKRGETLTKLHCHVVYTIPLALLYSSKSNETLNRLGKVSILPMIPTLLRDGTQYSDGLDLLRQMVMARAFPDVHPVEERLAPELVQQIFKDGDKTVLDRLCQISGGHFRTLLRVLQSCLSDECPISSASLERVIQDERDGMAYGGFTSSDWEMLRKVEQEKDTISIGDIENYQHFLSQLWLLEYKDPQGKWFGVNPLLKETTQFKSKSSQLG